MFTHRKTARIERVLPLGLRFGRVPVPLTPVLEPVADLSQGESRDLGQVPLLRGRRVPVVLVQILQCVPGPLLETIHGLLAVPDSPRQRVLPPETVQVLQRRMVGGAEAVVLQDAVQLLVAGLVERNKGLRLQYALVAA